MWPAGAKGPLAPDLLHNRRRQYTWNRSKGKLFKKLIPTRTPNKQKAVFWLCKSNLETFDKNIRLLQVCQVFSANMKISSVLKCVHVWVTVILSSPSILPPPHMEKNCWDAVEYPDQPWEGGRSGAGGGNLCSTGETGGRRSFQVLNQANCSGGNIQGKAVLYWATIQISLEVKERVYSEIK